MNTTTRTAAQFASYLSFLRDAAGKIPADNSPENHGRRAENDRASDETEAAFEVAFPAEFAAYRASRVASWD